MPAIQPNPPRRRARPNIMGLAMRGKEGTRGEGRHAGHAAGTHSTLARSAHSRSAPSHSTAAAPERRCILSGEVLAKEALLRFVVGPDGVLVPDFGNKLPGRGLWLRPSREGLQKAAERNLFSRAARQAVRLPEDLPELVARQLRQRCLDRLALARRAGEAVAGHDKVRGWLKEGAAALLLQATDGAAEPRRRLAALGRGHRPELNVIELFSAGELGQALGRDAAVHVAVASGGLADTLYQEAARLRDYEKMGPTGQEVSA